MTDFNICHLSFREARDRATFIELIDLDGAMIGMITLDRRDAERAEQWFGVWSSVTPSG
ncbi:hypothetical protein AB0O76_04150 [Streptomyces sp. NPDC086554]|uniref:hypothetical protein n=1 Tax=Streptomyces sp. NPDC086554 TaxID=3154864 RepID=UPI0034467225